MEQPRLIVPPPRSTPAGLTSSRRELPADLQRQASRRLGVMALVAAALWLATTIFFHVALAQTDPAWLGWQSSDAISIVGILVSLAVFAYTRGDRDPRALLDLGLVFMVAMAAAAGLIQHWHPSHTLQNVEPQVSWVGALVIISAAIVPASPVRMLVAGVLAVSMNPFGMLIARVRGVWLGPFSDILIMHVQDYLLVGVAVVISGVYTRLGQEVAKARAMGSYQLGDLIGRGGMGEVYRATHRMLARPAAVKLIRPEVAAQSGNDSLHSMTSRFRREATAAAKLRSPHTVELYDFGVTDDGTMYFAMELLEGLDLQTLVQRNGPLPAARVVHILRQVCASLAEAHQAGLVHRDIKPANIHVGRLGLVDDFVKVLDFGLVKSTAAVDVTQTQATAHGTALGTPAFMAPEVALGQPIDGRTDLYSLGCVAYFLLTGQQVFAGGEGLHVIVKRLHEDPVPPSKRTELEIPPDLEQIVMRCLAREPAGRPRDAVELDKALAAVSGPPWTADDAEEWWKLRGAAQSEGVA
jgi:serine/threonine-protein kinase